MAPKTAHDAARAKAAKEKKILALLALPLLIAVFYAYHTLTKLHHSSSPSTIPAAATVSTGTPVSDTTAATTTPVASIAAPADNGKLSRMTLFAPKDPFHDQGPRVSAAAGGSSSGGSSGGSGGSSSKTGKTGSKSKLAKQAPLPPPTSAVIAVNGRIATVVVGSVFPVTADSATNGIFRLVGLTAKTAKVAVVGGSYTSGSHTLKLKVNSVVTLVNTADGKRYTLILYPQGTVTPGAAATPTATTTTTTGP